MTPDPQRRVDWTMVLLDTLGEIADRIHIQRLGRRATVFDPKRISMSDTVEYSSDKRPFPSTY